MLTFIVGVFVGSCSMLFVMSLMTVAKNADHRMELSMSKES